MFRGLYNAVSTMNTAQKRLDAASNNMANANTTGYKKDMVVSEAFPEVLITKLHGTQPVRPFSANVSIVDEMVRMITAQRAYELSSRVIQTSDEMMGMANNLRR